MRYTHFATLVLTLLGFAGFLGLKSQPWRESGGRSSVGPQQHAEVSLQPSHEAVGSLVHDAIDPTVDQKFPLPPTSTHVDAFESVLRLAQDCYRNVNEIDDYSCVFIKRERINGQLNDREFVFAKVRHGVDSAKSIPAPFGVYLKFLAPGKMKGREILYVDGQNDGKIVFRKGGPRLAFLTGTIDPFSLAAMMGNRYPITEFGLKRLVERMIDLGQKEANSGQTNFRVLENVTFEESGCYTCIEIDHAEQKPEFEFHLARIYVDPKIGVPVRFESYLWPESADEPPPLMEEYTYTQLEFNVGLEAVDFDPQNPKYGFR